MTYQTARRSGRISVAVAILLIGSDSEGRVFSEETKTVVISLHGAGILSRHKLVPEQELILRSLESDRETDIRVVGEIGSQGDFHAYGVAFVQEVLDFWKASFPPLPASQEHSMVLSLECAGCNAPLVLEHSDFEFDVCAIHGGLVRYCDSCGFATVWKLPSQISSTLPRVPASTQVQQPTSTSVAVLERPEESTPVPEQSFQKQLSLETLADFIPSVDTNRRLFCRARVNYYACVRSEAFGDDIVPCIDMSRGGLSFKTPRSYTLSTLVRIAVPYSREAPEAPAIFVPARIVNTSLIPQSELFRGGVEFLPLR